MGILREYKNRVPFKCLVHHLHLLDSIKTLGLCQGGIVYKSLTVLFLLFMFGSSVHAESIAHGVSALGAAALGIVRPTGPGELKDEAKNIFENTIMIRSSKGLCSATRIGRCVLSAKHCFDKGSEGINRFYFTGDTTKEKVFVDAVATSVAFPPGKNPPDLAIAKLETPISKVALTREVIPTNKISAEAIEKRVTGNLFGYGNDQVTLTKDFTAQYRGQGKRQAGSARLVSYDGETGTIKVEGKKKDREAPSAPFPGDSGGPLVINSKVHGVAKKVDGRLTIKGGATVSFNDMDYTGGYTSVSSHREWILDTLKELNCETSWEKTPKETELNKELASMANSFLALHKALKSEVGEQTYLVLPYIQKEYWRKVVLARLRLGSDVKLPNTGVMVANDFLGNTEENPSVTEKKLRMMIGDPRTRKSLYTVEIEPKKVASTQGKEGITIKRVP